jgi:membrane protease YdiL (CAAX protease family)
MLARIVILWVIANFLLAGVVCTLAGEWYLAWPPLAAMLVELGLIMLPNLLLPILALRHWWPEPVGSVRDALGWWWNGCRSVVVGTTNFVLAFGLSSVISSWFGGSIPYQLPGGEGMPTQSLGGLLGLLLVLFGLMAVTVAGEETMYRGLIQTQVGARYGRWWGLLLGTLLFGLRHLPADLFYARAWAATPQMWLTRQVQLYSGALLFGLGRYLGRSTYAPAIAHTCYWLLMLFV